ncbi:DUF2007 domain-containing protein [Lysobacter sp. KIS68-7]|uniref:putative signal transducing protein n=1 Tax=Lysobacter sp. KIS68-7 TaxID=2904252 RepID=UPI001E4CD0EB|nr:DUF2007 domain-containing protein [Lysobacter sp. KIS68-7]UHQ20137.1 DUF2007 domain-containing protein [Lysobacter sp. KIS68-7]
MTVTIERFLDPWEAHVVKGRLIAEGIDASVSNDQLSMVDWPMAFALGGTALQVPDEDAPRARDVLAAYHRGDFEQDLVDEGYLTPSAPDETCACGTHQFQIPWRERVRVVLMFLLVGATYPTRTSGRCNACGRLRA